MAKFRIKAVEDSMLAYVQSDVGEAEYKTHFPNDTEQNPKRKAAKLLGYYINKKGRKWLGLAQKLGHEQEYWNNQNNYGNYFVTKAKESLDAQADDEDRRLAQLRAPASNNDINAADAPAASFGGAGGAGDDNVPDDAHSVTPAKPTMRRATPPGEEVSKKDVDRINDMMAKLGNNVLNHDTIMCQNNTLIRQNMANIKVVDGKLNEHIANQEAYNASNDDRVGNLEHELLLLRTAEKKRQEQDRRRVHFSSSESEKDDAEEQEEQEEQEVEEEYRGVKKGLFHDESAGNYDSDDQTGYI